MQQSKLIHLLKALPKNEFNDLGKFLRSPYLNSNKRLIIFYDILKKYYPEFESPKLAKSIIFKKIFPSGKPFKDKELRALMSDFSKAIENFLAHHELKQGNLLRRKHLAKSLSKKNDFKALERATDSLIEDLKKGTERGTDYYLDVFGLNRDLYFHSETTSFQKSSGRIEAIMHNLDLFYVLSKLRLSFEFFARQQLLGESHEISLLSESKQIALERFSAENPLFEIYANLVSLYQESFSIKKLSEVRRAFEKHLQLLQKGEQEIILRSLLNYANRKITEGETEYFHEMWELYKLGLRKNLFIQNQKLPYSTFLNILVTAVYLKEWNWAEEFMSDYQHFLDENHRIDTLNYGKAYFLFSLGNYAESSKLLIAIEHKDLNFSLRLKPLTIKCFYELSLKESHYHDFLWSQIEAFEKSLHRNKILSQQKRQANLNFCQLTKKLLKGKYAIEPKFVIKANLEKELNDKKYILHKKWLIQKIERL